MSIFLLFYFIFRVFDKKEFFRQNYDKELFSFKSRLGLEFHDEKILLAAFTHESYEVDHVGDDSDNNKTLQSRENNTKLSLLGESSCLKHKAKLFWLE